MLYEVITTYDRFAKSKSYSNLVIIQSKINWEKIAKRATFVKTSGHVITSYSIHYTKLYDNSKIFSSTGSPGSILFLIPSNPASNNAASRR